MVCLFFGKKTTVPEVDEILDWGLEPDPTLRPSATQLLEKLSAVVNSMPPVSLLLKADVNDPSFSWWKTDSVHDQ